MTDSDKEVGFPPRIPGTTNSLDSDVEDQLDQMDSTAEAKLVRKLDLFLIPVVMLSTSAAQGDVATAYTLHASSYLVKAPGFDAFLKQVDTFLTYWRETRLAHA